jgi:predicted lipoprotein with Yx(FWY)xxD motif
MTRSMFAAALAALTLAAGACGGDDTQGTSSPGTGEEQAAAGPPPTVSIEQVDGVGAVLVDREGAALYTSEQEADGTVRCRDDCLGFWLPLEASGDPTGPDELSGTLGTVERPDGSTQVTYNGVPLYRFSDDREPGQVTGDGLSDAFGGTTFTWHAATTEGTSDAGGDGRGYGY